VLEGGKPGDGRYDLRTPGILTRVGRALGDRNEAQAEAETDGVTSTFSYSAVKAAKRCRVNDAQASMLPRR
jgi:hypothetical protein